MCSKDAKIESLGYLEEKLEDLLDYVHDAKEFEEKYDCIETSVRDIAGIIDHVKEEMQKMTVGARVILTHGNLQVYEEWEEEQAEEKIRSREELIAYQKAMQTAISEVKKQFNVSD